MSRTNRVIYHQRRAEQEVAAAAKAIDKAIMSAHYQLSCLHLDALATLDDGDDDRLSSQLFMLSSKSG